MNVYATFCLILSTFFQLSMTGRWVTLTTDNTAYQMANGLGVPVTGRSHVIFEVKVCKGAEIQLMEDQNGAWVYYRLGGDNNEWSAIAASEQCNESGCTWIDYVATPILDCVNHLQFWMSWDSGGKHEIGLGDTFGDNVHLSGQLVTGFDVNILQVSNFDDIITAEWKFLIDEPPEFISPSPIGISMKEVTEDTAVGSTVYNVTGTDPEGDTLVYMLDTHDDVFELSGTALKTRHPLDYENTTSYSILISVSDGRNTLQTLLTLRVVDVVDEAPVITLSTTQSLLEELPVGSVVTYLFSVDDRDVGDVLTYSISGVNSNLFTIDAMSGVLSIAERIDRDQASLTSVTFDLQVTDSNNLQAVQTLVLNINDVNDNDPVFTSSSYYIEVLETVPSDSSLIDFVVNDADSGTNADFSISIISGDDVNSKFKVNGNQLQTGANGLDYETLNNTSTRYSLIVAAVNTDTTRTGVAYVSVQVIPENEADPVFESPSVDGSNQFPEQTVAEDAPLDVIIPFTASDADRGRDGDVTFSIVSVVDSEGTDGKSKFTIDSVEGNLRLLQPLDADFDTGGVQYYDVTIRITDGGNPSRTAEGTMRLTVTNVNDNAPEFSHPYYTVSISDDVSVGVVVGTVDASDADGDSITFTISGGGSGVFEMSGNNVVTSGLLDAAATPLYVITVRADDGQLQTEAPMTVGVAVSMATNFQIIVRQNVRIIEEQPSGRVIDGVFRTVGNTGAVTYTLEGPNANYLSVDSVTGELSYGSQRIDRDGVSGMTLLTDVSIKGVDVAGSVAVANLNFNIIDMNDNAPTSSSLHVVVSIQENSENNQLVTSFTLSDVDEAENGDVTLVINSGNGEGLFSIVGSNLYVNGGSVDYESLPSDKAYSLVLHAMDSPSASTALTTAIQVVVNIIGENEFTPDWVSPNIGIDSFFTDISVLETTTPGVTVETFVASDNDDGDDGRVTYSLVNTKDPNGSEVTGKFIVTSEGSLVVASTLDNDVTTGGVSYYVVTVVAADNCASSSRSTTGFLKIIIEDDPSETSSGTAASQTSTTTTATEMWVMRSLVAVFGVTILALVSLMFKSILTTGSSSSIGNTGKVSPQSMVERPATITPHLSMESVRLPDEVDHFSWIEKEEAAASLSQEPTSPTG